jgi:hypothetical protein
VVTNFHVITGAHTVYVQLHQGGPMAARMIGPPVSTTSPPEAAQSDLGTHARGPVSQEWALIRTAHSPLKPHNAGRAT